MWIVLLSFGISLTFGQTPAPTHPTFSDNDGKISFDGDEGWRITKKATPNKDECQVLSDCRSEYNNIPFIGPFSDKYYLERNIECSAHSILTVSYDILSCGVDGNNKDKTTPFIYHSIVGATTTIKTTTASGQPLCSLSGSIGDWLTQTVPQHIQYVFTSNPLNGGERVPLKLKAFLDAGKVFVYNIQIKCTPTGQTPTPPPTLEGVSGPQNYGHDEYCISGFDVSARNQFNGEYIIRTKEDGLGDSVLLNVNGVGTEAFEKNDHRGDAFLYEIYDTQYQWAISSVLGSSNVADVVFKCTESDSTSQDHLDVHTDCNGKTAVNGETISIIKGECIDVHVTIGDSPFSILSFDLSVNQIKTITMLAILSFFSCILGMITCRCCQLICRRTKKNYKKLNKDMDDMDDVDF